MIGPIYAVRLGKLVCGAGMALMLGVSFAAAQQTMPEKAEGEKNAAVTASRDKATEPAPRKHIRVVGEGGVVPASRPKEEREVDAVPVSPDTVSSEEPTAPFASRDIESMEPFLQMRMLQSLQGQTAKGSTQAFKAQRSLIELMNRSFKDAPAYSWRDPRNARAAVLLLLSGGHPSVGSALLEMKPGPEIDRRLLEGALDYIEGRKAAAYEKLTSINPLDLEAGLGSQIALVQAVLFLPHELHEALAAVDKARLLMPGSLVEEAALRRGVSVAAALGDTRLFQTYALQYLRHYRDSIYSNDFHRRFGLAMRHFGDSHDKDSFDNLNVTIAEFDLDSRRRFYLLLSYASLVQGNLDLAHKAAGAALPLSMDHTEDRARAQLYLAGSMLEADRLDDALKYLWAVKRGDLSERDLLLADRVGEVLNTIRHWPEADKNSFDFTARKISLVPENADWQLDSIVRARKEIESADQLLSYSDKPLSEASQ